MHQPDNERLQAVSDAVAEPPGSTPQVLPVVRPVRLGVSWWLVAAIIAVDQASKLAIIGAIQVFDTVALVPGLLNLVHVQNPGVAFGFLNNLDDAYQKIVTTLLAVVALVGIGYYARHIRPEEWLARLGLSVILGGALGNLIDRLRLGYVTDFVDVYWGSWHFWAFNVADASITIGAIMVFSDLLIVSRHASDSV